MFKAIKRNVFVRVLYITHGKFKEKKKRNEKDPTHKVTDVGSHQRTREPGRGGAVRGPAGARGRVVLAVCSRSPHPLPQPSISSRQQNMTMLAFFISLTLPLIKQ